MNANLRLAHNDQHIVVVVFFRRTVFRLQYLLTLRGCVCGVFFWGGGGGGGGSGGGGGRHRLSFIVRCSVFWTLVWV